jgi:ATP-binding cassette subfamily B protein
VQGLTSIYQTLRKATVALETTYEILDADEVVADEPDAVDMQRAHGDVRFDRITFTHANGRVLFEDLSLHVRAGETVALVGPSGSGKTTLTSLLLRLHPLASGSITVDGQDVRSITAESLRRQIGYVGQDIHLFNDTVAANIAFGSPGASSEDVEVAARCANAHDFILSLPGGYDTVIGERGSRLSGGQRQRIAIARAILKNAPILVLDEATSALDNVSEAAVQEALEHLRTGRTTIVIAHRLSTVLGADRIVLLKDGRILGEGTHGELLRNNEYYAELVGAAGGDLLVPLEGGITTASSRAA